MNISFMLPSTMFLGAASAVTAGALMINYRERPDKVHPHIVYSYNDDSTNCSLKGSYGDGILATNIISIVFNAMLFITMMQRYVFLRGRGIKAIRTLMGILTVVSAAVMIAIAAAGYNLYVQQNFCKRQTDGRITCDADIITGNCERLEGHDMNVVLGLNSTAIALSGLVMMSGFVVMLDKEIGQVTKVGKSAVRAGTGTFDRLFMTGKRSEGYSTMPNHLSYTNFNL